MIASREWPRVNGNIKFSQSGQTLPRESSRPLLGYCHGSDQQVSPVSPGASARTTANRSAVTRLAKPLPDNAKKPPTNHPITR